MQAGTSGPAEELADSGPPQALADTGAPLSEHPCVSAAPVGPAGVPGALSWLTRPDQDQAPPALGGFPSSCDGRWRHSSVWALEACTFRPHLARGYHVIA